MVAKSVVHFVYSENTFVGITSKSNCVVVLETKILWINCGFFYSRRFIWLEMCRMSRSHFCCFSYTRTLYKRVKPICSLECSYDFKPRYNFVYRIFSQLYLFNPWKSWIIRLKMYWRSDTWQKYFHGYINYYYLLLYYFIIFLS